ncbi:hypothetical protein, partial [Klebsiella pneumoniae]|uniref:hypothetical protein n=1 Tax=Klebsiella pneumoniae TaxID=573 RepID=UPI00272F21A3
GSNNSVSRENATKAKHILDQGWRNRIYSGPFFVYTYENQEGEKFGNALGVVSFLQTVVKKRFPKVFDFFQGLTENHFKLTNGKASAKC